MAKGSIKSKIPIVKIDEFVLHRTQKEKYRDAYESLACDLEHHTMSATEIFSNSNVKNNFIEVVKRYKDYKYVPYVKTPEYIENPIKYFEKNYIELKKVLENDFKSLINTYCIGDLQKIADKLIPKYIKSNPKLLQCKPKFEEIIEKKRTYSINNKKVSLMNEDEINKYCSNYFEEFTDPLLDKEVRNFEMIGHSETFTNRAKFIKKHFEKFLSSPSITDKKKFHLDGFINDNEYIKKIAINSKKLSREKEEDYSVKSNINLNYFNDFIKKEGVMPNFNAATGLSLLIGSIWAYEVKIKNLVIYNDKSYDYDLDFIVYDHFSLDGDDVNSNSQGNWIKKASIQMVTGFTSWYILQFYNNYSGYTPIITKIQFSYTKKELENEKLVYSSIWN